MKIEIEFEEVEALKNNILALEGEVKEYDQRIKTLTETYNEDALQEETVKLASAMFESCFRAMTNKMGFTSPPAIMYTDNLNKKNLFGRRQFDDISFNIGAEIIEGYGRALLSIGIDYSVWVKKKEEWVKNREENQGNLRNKKP